MRKLLLSTTAIATVAALTSGVIGTMSSIALADDAKVNVTASTEWKYNSRTSDTTAVDGTSFNQDSEIKFAFSNKTDSGLTIGYTVELESDAGSAAAQIDESSLSISGGFGTVILGQNDSAGEDFGMGAKDIIAEEETPGIVSSSIGGNADIAVSDGDNNKIQYKLPAMGGLTLGASYTDSGAVGSTDTTAYGARYVMSVGETELTAALAMSTTDATTATDSEQQNVGIKVVNGNITLSASQSEATSTNDELKNQAFAVSYKLANGMTIGAYTFDSQDDLDIDEDYKSSGVELQYTVAAGLTAVVNVDDYKYTAATTNAAGVIGGLADKGSNTKVTLKASF